MNSKTKTQSISKFKKILCLLLSLMMMFSIIPMGTITASAATISLNRPTDKAYTITAREYYSSGSYHGAIDYGCPRGTPVYAAESGTITVYDGGYGDGYSGSTAGGGWGNYADIAHSNGYKTRYAHMTTGRFVVKTGAKVERGQLIGYSGTSGNSTGPHLHFGLYLNGNKVYPESYIKTATGYHVGTTVQHTVDTKYGKNFTAYPKAKITASNIFDENHNQISSTAWIGTSDKCTIHEVYTDGCCKVTYPISSGTVTAYSKISLFNTHTHNYSGARVYESEHPHAISQRCVDYDTCGGFIWTGEYYKVNTCEKCWNIDWDCSVSSVSIIASESKTISISIDPNTACFPDDAKLRYEYDDTIIDMTHNGQEFIFTGKKKGSCTFAIVAFSSTSGATISRFSIPITVDTKNYTVTYNANGGSPTFQDTTNQDGSFVFTSREPTRTGYTFLGWHTNKDSAKASLILEPGKKLNASEAITFYAIWKPNEYSVVYNANGGTGITASSSHVYDTAKALTSNGFTRTGYTFAGWSTNSAATATQYGDGESVKNLTSTNGATVNLYVRWKPNEYSVAYNANGGTGTMANSNHTYDITKSLSANRFTRDGYTFLGWSKSSTATTPTYADGQSVKNLISTNGEVTLYAVWEKNLETVSTISIQSKPSKTVYKVGETFSSSGLSVKVNMSDGTSKTVTSGFTVSSPDMSTAGTKTVTVTYEGKTTTFTITVNKNVDENAQQVIVESKRATKGSEITVAVKIKNNPGITSMRLHVAYDTSALTLINVTDGGILGTNNHPDNLSVYPYILSWANDTVRENFTSDGTIATLTFAVSPDAEFEDYEIKASYDNELDEITNVDMDVVDFVPIDGIISISNALIGDVNGDGKITSKDRIILSRHLDNWEGYETLYNPLAADINGDGKVTSKDRIILSRYLDGWGADYDMYFE